MKGTLLACLLSLTVVCCFAQDSSSSKIITRVKNHYEINGQKIKDLKPYLLTYEESASEYRISKRSLITNIVFLGIGVAELAVTLTTKNAQTAKIASLCGGIPSIVGMLYFGLKSGKHLRKSIDAYNKAVSAH